MEVIWKDIRGYEGFYQASNMGQVRSLPRNGTIKAPRIMKPTKHHKGYYILNLQKEGKGKMFFVQRLVWEAFNGPIPQGLQVNHIDENKANNALSNLNLMTPKENINWGTAIRRRANKYKKPIMQYTLDGQEFCYWFSATDAAIALNLNRKTINKCLNGITKSSGGYIWRFTN